MRRRRRKENAEDGEEQEQKKQDRPCIRLGRFEIRPESHGWSIRTKKAEDSAASTTKYLSSHRSLLRWIVDQELKGVTVGENRQAKELLEAYSDLESRLSGQFDSVMKLLDKE